MSDTLFDKIVKKEIPSWIIWENNDYLAFLTPFPNTPGACVVIPKTNPGDYIFDINPDVAAGLYDAAKQVSKLLENSLEVKRVAMVVEGTGVPYAHIKLYPLHGQLATGTSVISKQREFHPEYVGWLSTLEGPQMNDEELDAMKEKITGSK